MENGWRHIGVSRRWLCVTGGYESSQCADIFFNLVPCFPPGAYVFRLWWCSTEPCKRANEFFHTMSFKIHILVVASQQQQKRKEKGRQTLHKEKKLQDRGTKKGTKGNGGWTDLEAEKSEIKLVCIHVIHNPFILQVFVLLQNTVEYSQTKSHTSQLMPKLCRVRLVELELVTSLLSYV